MGMVVRALSKKNLQFERLSNMLPYDSYIKGLQTRFGAVLTLVRNALSESRN